MHMFFLLTGLFLITFADSIDAHNKDLRELAVKILSYEKRVDTLVEQKKTLKEGAELEATLSEISELQRELVAIRKSRRILREHIEKNHPKEELMEDLSLLKDYEGGNKKKQGDPAIDSKLDDMIQKLRTQYARTDRAHSRDTLKADEEIEKQLANKKRDLQRESKDDYIKENIKSKLEIE